MLVICLVVSGCGRTLLWWWRWLLVGVDWIEVVVVVFVGSRLDLVVVAMTR